MTSFPVVLALDLGTGSVKAALVDARGAVVAQASERYPVAAPRPGWSETDPGAWWRGAVAATRAVLAGHAEPEVRAISLSGQMHGVTLSDAAGRPLRPAILWSDTRSAPQLAAYQALAPHVLDRLRNPPVAGFAGPTLRWLREHEPGALDSARWALQPKDWLRLHLTGEAASEPSDASGTLLYDLEGARWDEDVLAALDVNPALLPPLRASADVAGLLRPERAAELGLPPGLSVVTGAADTAAALLGTGLQGGEAQLTVGTGAQVVLASRALPAAQDGLHIFADAAGGHYTLAALQNAGNVLEWARGVLGLSWTDFYAAAKEAPGPLPLFLPSLTGERSPRPDPQARGAWLGLDAAHGPGHLAAAAFEGVALSVARGAAALNLADETPLYLAGGGSVDPWWRQRLADALGRPLLVTDAPGASALGAARLAWQGLGEALPPARPAVVAPVAPGPGRLPPERHAHFQAALDTLRPWFAAAGPE